MSTKEPLSPAPPPAALGGTPPQSASVEALFRAHNQSLVRFLAARLSSDAEAKEVAQEAYVRLLQLDQPAAVGFLRAFLFKTASNIATDRLRRRRLAKAAWSADPLDVDIDHLSPEQHVSSTEEMEVVSHCLNELSPRCRQAVLLSRVEGKRLHEVAEDLGVSTRMVKRYITESLIVIRKRLDAMQTARVGRKDGRGQRHG